MNDEWRPPPWLFDRLNAKFGPFDLDAAATAGNRLCPRFWTREDDALTKPWEGRVFCNPPYSKAAGGPGEWLAKTWIEIRARRAAMIVLLLPLDATRWGADAFMRSSAVILFDGRLSFVGTDGRPVRGNRYGSTVFVLEPGE